jgi:hypothetical protein
MTIKRDRDLAVPLNCPIWDSRLFEVVCIPNIGIMNLNISQDCSSFILRVPAKQICEIKANPHENISFRFLFRCIEPPSPAIAIRNS